MLKLRIVGASYGKSRACGIYLILACFILLLLPLEAHSCELSSAKEVNFGYAKISPLDVRSFEDQNKTSKVSVKFAFPYVISEIKRSSVVVCINATKYLAKKSQIMVSDSKKSADLTDISLDRRPKLQLWKSRDTLASFLQLSTASRSSHDLVETIAKVKGAYSFPLYSVDYMDTSIGSQQIEVANILVPIPYKALDLYKSLKVGSSSTKKELFFIVDVSNSTRGFLKDFIQTLSKEVARRSYSSEVSIKTFQFRDDVSLDVFQATSLRQLASYNFANTHQASIDETESAGLVKALKKATGLLGKHNEAQLIVLAGGDVNLEKPINTKGFRASYVVKLTPELQDRLKNSSVQIKGAKFFPFSRNSVSVLASQIDSIFSKDNDNEETIEAIRAEFAKINSIPLIPKEADDKFNILPPAGVNFTTEWFTISSWTVLNPQVLQANE